jgi:hypothetical protein
MREANSTRECIDCGDVLPMKKFSRVHGGREGYRRKNCIRCRNIKQRYGISGKMFYEMLENQLSSCLICENPINEKTACVDHCHDGKNVRGLLCSNCNTGIGLLAHNKEVAYRAFEYLRFFK